MKPADDKKYCISNLRFADDVMLTANSVSQLRKMMTAFKRSTERQGLNIHPQKPKMLTNQGSNRQREIDVEGMRIEMLPLEGKVKYLGQMSTFES